MNNSQIALVIVNAFVGVTAIGGGIARPRDRSLTEAFYFALWGDDGGPGVIATL